MVISTFYFIKKPTRGFTGLRDFPVGAGVKNQPANARGKRGMHMTPESGISLEEEMATHSRILAWKIPRTEEPGGLQSMGWQRVRHNSVTKNVYLTLRY